MITKERLDEIKNFLSENKRTIWNVAFSISTPLTDSIVYLDNIIEGKLKLVLGYHIKGKRKKLKDIEDSIEIYRLKRNWSSKISYEELCWEIIEDDEGNIFTYRTPKHKDFDGKRPLTSKEQWIEIYEVGFKHFEKEFDIEKIIEKIKEKFNFNK